MKKIMTCLAVSGLMWMTLVGVVRAEEENSVEISILGGGAIPTHDGAVAMAYGDMGPSPLAKLSLMWQASPAVGLGFEVGSAWNHDVTFSGYGSLLGFTFERRVLQITPQLELGKWFGSVKPYVMVGGGMYHIQEELNIPFLGSMDHSDSYGGVNGGVGLLVKLNDRVAIGPDVRYHHILTSDDDYDYVDAAFRFMLRF